MNKAQGMTLETSILLHKQWLESDGALGSRFVARNIPEFHTHFAKKSRTAEFGAVRLDGADFSDVKIPNASFSGTSLKDVDFSRTNLDGATFRSTNMSGAVFNYANLDNTTLQNVRADNMMISRGRAHNMSIDGGAWSITLQDVRADFMKVANTKSAMTISGGEIPDINFTNSTMKLSVKDGASMVRSVFRKTDVALTTENSDMNSATFEKSIMTGSRIGPKTILHNALFERASLAGAEISGANLNNVEMNMVSLEGASIRNTVMRHAIVGARMNGATIDGVDVTGADLAGLTGVPKSVINTRLDTAQYTSPDVDAANNADKPASATNATHGEAMLMRTMGAAPNLKNKARLSRNLAIDAEINAEMTARKKAPKTGAYAPPMGRFARLMSRVRAYGAKITGHSKEQDDENKTERLANTWGGVVRPLAEQLKAFDADAARDGTSVGLNTATWEKIPARNQMIVETMLAKRNEIVLKALDKGAMDKGAMAKEGAPKSTVDYGGLSALSKAFPTKKKAPDLTR